MGNLFTKNRNITSFKDIIRINEEQIEFARGLEKDGHNCVRLLDSYPVQVSWCGEKPCSQSSTSYPNRHQLGVR